MSTTELESLIGTITNLESQAKRSGQTAEQHLRAAAEASEAAAQSTDDKRWAILTANAKGHEREAHHIHTCEKLIRRERAKLRELRQQAEAKATAAAAAAAAEPEPWDV